MTRATRICLFAPVLWTISLAAGPLAAQNYQPAPATQQGAAPSRYAPQAQPAGQQGSVYGPAVSQAAAPQAAATQYGPQPQQGAQQAQFQQGQVQPGQAQPGQVRPVAGQQPIRQPNGVFNPQANAAQDPLNVPRAAVVPAGPVQPEGFPLQPEVQAWVDNVLKFWEQRSDKIKTLQCTFQKWEYDPSYMPNETTRLQVAGKLHELPFRSFSKGTIKYAAPDKGLFKVDTLQTIELAKPGEQHTYFNQPPENGEHWVCDGKRVFAFDSRSKQVIEQLLPPEMQGKALADGPLPFMFGARAETIKARYWIRPLKAERPGEYCLEATPKSRQDAANFKQVIIVLDEQVYLPIRMQIYERDYSPQNPHRTAYVFSDREENKSNHAGAVANLLDPLKLTPWHREFFEVQTPSGWKRVVMDPPGAPQGPQQGPPPGPGANTAGGPNAAPQGPAQATRPNTPQATTPR
jgi:TIGR03009 family protein